MCFDSVKIRVYYSPMKQKANQNSKTSKYHHGDLRQALIDTATSQIEQNGVNSLSMRKLGELVGVSRTALYHHFSNKSDLLSAVAESGFNDWQSKTEQVLSAQDISQQQLLISYVQSYFHFALENSAKYELMFGQALWAHDQSSEALHQVAYKSFEFHVDVIRNWQQVGILNSDLSSLRVAQVTWGTLHGISKLFIDGIYVDHRNLDELATTVVNLMLSPEIK